MLQYAAPPHRFRFTSLSFLFFLQLPSNLYYAYNKRENKKSLFGSLRCSFRFSVLYTTRNQQFYSVSIGSDTIICIILVLRRTTYFHIFYIYRNEFIFICNRNQCCMLLIVKWSLTCILCILGWVCVCVLYCTGCGLLYRARCCCC